MPNWLFNIFMAAIPVIVDYIMGEIFSPRTKKRVQSYLFRKMGTLPKPRKWR